MDPAVWAARVQSISPKGFLILPLVAVVAAVLAFSLAWRNWRRARFIEDTPTARIRSAPQGRVELSGRAQALPGPPVVAPLTGRSCLWYRYRIEREHQEGRGGHRRWTTVRSGASDDLFGLDDGTGLCVVDPEGAEVVPGEKDVWYGDHEWPAAGPRPRQSRWWGRFGSGDYRYTEERLVPGPLYAIGWFRTERDGEDAPGQEVAALMRSWKQEPDRMRQRFDRDGDGEIDAAEWGVARAAAEREVLTDRAERSMRPGTHVLGRPPAGDWPFVLSARPEADLTRLFRRRAAGALAAFLAAAAVLLWLIAARTA